VNRHTQQLEPRLADRWTQSSDGRSYTLHLRDAQFADGHPFTADDVAFSFGAVYDARTASPLAAALRINGKPLEVRTLGAHDVEIRFPAPYGPGLRLLENLPIYPRHRLQPALDAGTLAKAWGPTAPPGDIIGLGPFTISGYDTGQRVALARNPHYWRVDDHGARLPYLDRLTLELVPDQNAELIRLRAGQVDLMQNELRAEDYLPVKQDADAGRVRLLDIGVSLDTHMLWFNLGRPGQARPWLERDEFRQAISHAVDRSRFARAVYLGAAEPAWSIVSAANKEWYDTSVPRRPYDLTRAQSLLATIGLRDTNGDGVLDDARGRPARFTLLIQKGLTASEKGSSVLRESLAAIGIAVDVVAMDLGSMMERWSKGDYDAIYHLLIATDTDPAGNADLWQSSGSMHLWHPNQTRPATDWEARIDTLMTEQVGTPDVATRRRLFNEVQHLMAEHEPMVVFAAPHVYVATSARLGGVVPSVQRPQILWNADTLTVTARAR
jgi:peptide/nickel transport system substrate-binding protein